MSRLPSRGEPDSVLSRRNFLIATTSAGLAFGFSALVEAAMDPAAPGGAPHVAAGPQFAPTLWFAIDEDGVVTVNIIRAEMGQHIGTALARILADELEVAWEKVRIVHVDTDPKWGLMITGGSWSVWQTFPIFSRAGAAGRIALIEAGAKLLKVSPAGGVARDGVVHVGGASISYGDIVRRGGVARQFTPAELEHLPIKPAGERKLVGKAVKALDIAAKTTGATVYGIDAKVPGMVYARPKLPPTRLGSRVLTVDDSAARSIKGYLRYLTLEDPSGTVPGWVLAIAETYPAAIRAADLLKVRWTAGPGAKVSEKDLQDHAAALVAKPDGGALLDTKTADTAPAFKAAKSVLERTYTTATVLHFQLEPLNALAFEKDGVMEVHTGNQWQSLIMPVLAKALDRPEASIIMRTYMLGGGFGRRLNGDYAVPAALAAKALGKPVKLVFTREDDARFDSVRSPSVQTVRMAFDGAGKVLAQEHHAAAGWPILANAPFLMPKAANGVAYDPFAISGADHWYEVGAHKVRAINNDLAHKAFRPGWLRSVGPGWTNWAGESFVDEAAHHLKVDPVDLRLRLLSGHGANAGGEGAAKGGARRQAEVVRRAAQAGGWGQAMPKDTGLGLATSFGQEREMPTWVACVARVHVDRATGVVTVQKLSVVVDAGTIVDPDGAHAQTEGATLWGMSMALFEGTQFVNGEVVDRNLDTYTPLRMSDRPPIDVQFVDSAEVPVGLGEPATTVVAPAIANAIFRAVGVRLRHIPIRSADVLRALADQA
ncbi:molybdopterin cofactor-binding domain-containing protein [Caulobacter segnis]|uniref:xanthine dehydrogenase family protein molybdopterin-binding subunit n=1 Tax=Caulobacter segnis TaxID=88688 RepID=UPI0028622A51|nr:molybdopterin cofactor-binding domain-containing protein [Caulobacter segnis]MDR6624397.1 CO/xanthine dehydrogenase Mo-binding subunit [Caulobacter segnis]